MMDSQVITYSALGALLLGGLTIIRFMWTIHKDLVQQKEKDNAAHATVTELVHSSIRTLDAAQGEKIKALHERVETNDKAIAERFERNNRECRANEKELGEKLVKLEVQMVTEASFDRKMDSLKLDIEGNVQKTVEAAISKSQSEILDRMDTMLKQFKP